MAKKVNQPTFDWQALFESWRPFCSFQLGPKTDFDKLPLGALFAYQHNLDNPVNLANLEVELADDRRPTRDKDVFYKAAKKKVRRFVRPEGYAVLRGLNGISTTREQRPDGEYEVQYVYPVTVASVRQQNLPLEAIYLIERCLDGYGEDRSLEKMMLEHVVTPDQMAFLQQHGLTLRDIFEGQYPGDVGDPIAVDEKIHEFFKAWNSKMEYKFFGT